MENIRKILTENGLKVTPQRLAVYDAIYQLNNHPSAEAIIEFIKSRYPNIAIGTVYNTLEIFVKKGIIRKIKTDGDVMRYDAILNKHHHLYSSDSKRIEDFYDEEINHFITAYMQRKKIPNFRIEDVNVQIVGRFTE